MSTTTSITTILLLFLALATTTSCVQELEILQMVQAQLQVARGYWVQYSSVALDGVDGGGPNELGVALRDCGKLYEESEYRIEELLLNANHTSARDDDDARTWLSGVLANHRTCLDGLKEKGLSIETPGVAQNLTGLLGEALALYGRGRGTRRDSVYCIRRMKVSFSKLIFWWVSCSALNRPPIGRRNGGMLTSWNPATSKADFVVARDGSGIHRTINEALAALGRMGKKRTQRVVIYVKAGVYNERVEIERHMKNVMFVGDGIDRTIVTANKNVPDGSSTYSSATFGVSGDGFWARDMTFENTAGPQKHQAVALRVNADLSVFYRCSFKAYQDTLFVHSLRQFYRDCHIYGTIDFIFGDAPVVLQNCDIFIRRPMRHQANMITAQGRDSPHENTGICIQGSRVRASPEFVPVKNSFRSFLGRPWKKYSRTVFIKTDLDGLIDPKGWTEWDGSYALSTLYYAEYMNIGAGASTQGRVKWPGFHVLRSPLEASPFTVSRFIQGESWIPASGVPFELGV
ncbi:putative pectinesterase/pectinesterase inhibitor 36 [Turnera subulata]|uniref:Pectinesterase n=1 Tax=Turnera subulata TaxID=218843 RepID=A0A9Q0J6C1_9ROSI|nr:putative pectinesterase/pectinesterase inhibitor 36 [Turnera subulata]